MPTQRVSLSIKCNNVLKVFGIVTGIYFKKHSLVVMVVLVVSTVNYSCAVTVVATTTTRVPMDTSYCFSLNQLLNFGVINFGTFSHYIVLSLGDLHTIVTSYMLMPSNLSLQPRSLSEI